MTLGSVVGVFHIAAIHAEGAEVFPRDAHYFVVTICSNSLPYVRTFSEDIRGASLILWIRKMTVSHPHAPVSYAL